MTAVRSWAVQTRPTNQTYLRAWQEDVKHWPVFGLKVLEADLRRFGTALCRRVAAGPRAPASNNTPNLRESSPDGRPRIVFVSCPSDIAPQIMKRIGSEMIARGLQVWLWDPLPFGFSDEEAGKIRSLVHGEPYLEATLQAARNADAVLFLISPRTVGSRTGAPVGRGISTVPRFQPPPRRTQHADFPHCAPPFASLQGLWDLSHRGNFRSVVSHSIAVEQS